MGVVFELVKSKGRSIYMDANATTPLLPEVLGEMRPWLDGRCGNASSTHRHGREARAAIDFAREQVAALLHCGGSEVIFTSGGTESDNLAVFGTVTTPGAHIITSSIEHHAVLHAVARMRRSDCTITHLPVDAHGRVNPEDVRHALRPNTRLVSIMMANNETGALQPVEEIGRITQEARVLFHTDAVQAAGKVPIHVGRIGCDLLSISGHKMHGPQGTGALFVRKGTNLDPIFSGGGHEHGLRPGTENIAGMVGMGKAAEMAVGNFRDGSIAKTKKLRDDLERSILAEVGDAGVNGGEVPRVPNTTNLWFGGVEGSPLLQTLDELGLSVSGGSACSAGSCQPSHVLLAMGLSMKQAASSVRFSLSKLSKAEDVDFAIWQVSEAIEQLRSAMSVRR
jgi:cysteine desulfurase